MELNSVVEAIGQWPVSDRLKLLEAVWDGISDADLESELSPETKATLEQRIAAADEHPNDGMSWDEIVAGVRRAK